MTRPAILGLGQALRLVDTSGARTAAFPPARSSECTPNSPPPPPPSCSARGFTAALIARAVHDTYEFEVHQR